ncbi:MAG: macro domain-containing protein [Lachnospiraceae bacterium]|nr:macro domain-containing protein [Lachnospiraceae bacterium]
MMEEIINIPKQISILDGSVFNYQADAMVLSANPYKDSPVGRGLDEEVYNMVGDGKEEVINIRNAFFMKQKTNRLEPGSIFVTSAGDMIRVNMFKKIIHVIVPPYKKEFIKGENDENLTSLRNIIESIFYVAKDNKIRSLTMPLIGSGARGFKHEDVKKIIVEAFINVLNSDKAYFDGFMLTIVDRKNKKRFKDYPGTDELLKIMENNMILPDYELMDEKWIKNFVNNIDHGTIKELKETSLFARDLNDSDIKRIMVKAILYRNKKNKGHTQNSFFDLLEKYRERINLTKSELARRADINKSILTKIDGKQSHLERKTIIKIAMALELSMEEAKDFICLGNAGIEFPNPGDDWEMRVADCIENKIYDVRMLKDELKKEFNIVFENLDTERGTDIDISRDDRDNDR